MIIYHFNISVDDLIKEENEIKKSTKSSSRSPSRCPLILPHQKDLGQNKKVIIISITVIEICVLNEITFFIQ